MVGIKRGKSFQITDKGEFWRKDNLFNTYQKQIHFSLPEKKLTISFSEIIIVFFFRARMEIFQDSTEVRISKDIISHWIRNKGEFSNGFCMIYVKMREKQFPEEKKNVQKIKV
jgi:hypothetical protein